MPKLKPYLPEEAAGVPMISSPFIQDVGRFAKQKHAMRRIFGTLAVIWSVALGIFVIGARDFVGDFMMPLLCFFGSLSYLGVFFLGALYWKTRISALMDFPELEVDSDTAKRGEMLTVRYRHRFNKDTTIEALRFQLVLQEWVRYTQGTNTYTDTRDRVMDEDWYEMEQVYGGQTHTKRVMLKIPDTAMHSWEASDNKLTWHVKLTVDLPGWIGDYSETFKIYVPPEA